MSTRPLPGASKKAATATASSTKTTNPMDEPRILIKRELHTAVTGPVTASLMAFPRGAFSSQTIETTDSARVLVLRQKREADVPLQPCGWSPLEGDVQGP